MAIYELLIEAPSAPEPQQSAVTTMNARYAMTLGDVSQLVEDLTATGASSFVDTVARLFTDPMENVISLKMFPFDITKMLDEWTALERSKVKISNVTLANTYAKYLDHGAAEWYENKTLPILLVGRFRFEKHYNDYRDASPFTKIEIWCPFVGFVPVDMSIAYTGTFSLQYAVDLYTGDFTMALVHHLEAYDEESAPGPGHVILIREGNMASIIQLAGSSASEYASRKFGIASSLVEGVVTGLTNPVAGASRALSGVMGEVSPVAVQKGAMSAASTGNFMPQSPYAVITRVTGWTNPASNADVIGRPTDAVLTLHENIGYIEADTVHVDGVNTGTSAEIEEIEQLLKSGVYM